MINLMLEEDILDFVSSFGVVKERQIYKFFRDIGPNNIQHTLKHLFFDHMLYCLNATGCADSMDSFPEKYNFAPERLWCKMRKLRHGTEPFHQLWKAIDVMIEIPSGDIKEFCSVKMPHEVCFLTTDNVIFDVMVFDDQNYMAYKLLEKQLRNENYPADEKDMINHVAVVANYELISKIRDLGFSIYVMVDNDGNILGKWRY